MEKNMRTFQVSDEMYEQLKTFIVDPFDDTPELVIGRLIAIVNKAKNRWAPFGLDEEEPEPQPAKMSRPQHKRIPDEEPVVVL
jgi:hypothetical protein